jgi:hypothetical protein
MQEKDTCFEKSYLRLLFGVVVEDAYKWIELVHI